MADIVITEFMDEAQITAQLDGFDVVYDPELVDQPARLLSLIGDARAIVVRNRTQLRGDLLHAAKRLKIVGRLGVGLDNIDMPACAARAIAVYPATGANDVAVAEYVIGAALMLIRGAFGASAQVAAGTWPRNQLMGGEVSGRQLGLVGFGAIARQTAHRALALGMKIAAFDPFVDPNHPDWLDTDNLSLASLLQTSDVISLHTPLTEDTRHLIDARALDQMKPTAILINAARGGIVDELALAHALRTRKIAGAALDVFETEPLTAQSGAIFSDIDTILLTPHIAGVTHEANQRVSAVTLQNVVRALNDLSGDDILASPTTHPKR